MVDTKALTDGIFVSSQIQPADLAPLAAEFRTIINNRPDGEEAGQPLSVEIEAEARRAGLEYAYIPVVPGRISENEVLALRQVLADAPRPILAFCRTGTRSTSLWALSEAGKRPADEILKIAADAGYELGELSQRLEGKAVSA